MTGGVGASEAALVNRPVTIQDSHKSSRKLHPSCPTQNAQEPTSAEGSFAN